MAVSAAGRSESTAAPITREFDGLTDQLPALIAEQRLRFRVDEEDAAVGRNGHHRVRSRFEERAELRLSRDRHLRRLLEFPTACLGRLHRRESDGIVVWKARATEELLERLGFSIQLGRNHSSIGFLARR